MHKDFHVSVTYSIMLNNGEMVKKLVSSYIMKLSNHWELNI